MWNFMKSRALILKLHLLQNVCRAHIDTQTDRYFPKVVELCSGHSEKCQTSKTRSLEILRKQYFLIICRKKKKWKTIWQCPFANCVNKNTTSILNIKFCAILSNRSRNLPIPRIPEKVEQHRNLLSNFHN